MHELETLPAAAPAEARPKPRWIVWWQARPNQWRAMCSVCGLTIGLTPGEIYRSHCRVFPSKDTAETWAQDLIAIMLQDPRIREQNLPWTFWAMPEGEGPGRGEGDA